MLYSQIVDKKRNRYQSKSQSHNYKVPTLRSLIIFVMPYAYHIWFRTSLEVHYGETNNDRKCL